MAMVTCFPEPWYLYWLLWRPEVK